MCYGDQSLDFDCSELYLINYWVSVISVVYVCAACSVFVSINLRRLKHAAQTCLHTLAKHKQAWGIMVTLFLRCLYFNVTTCVNMYRNTVLCTYTVQWNYIMLCLLLLCCTALHYCNRILSKWEEYTAEGSVKIWTVCIGSSHINMGRCWSITE